MILTPPILARLVGLIVLAALLEVSFFSGIELFGAVPAGAVLVVMSLGLLGGSLTGAVGGFSVGLLIDCLLIQTLGAFALSLLVVGYVAGRYRENVGRPRSGAVALLGGALTLLGVASLAAVQIGTGVDADVSTLVVRDAISKSLVGAALALPVFYLVRLLLRPALVDDRPAGRRGLAPGAVGTRS